MAEPKARKALADRAAEIFNAGGKSYSEAVDAALNEMNPSKDAAIGERLLYALLNVEERVRHPRRPSPRAKASRTDLEPPTPGTPTQSAEGDAKDGDETHVP